MQTLDNKKNTLKSPIDHGIKHYIYTLKTHLTLVIKVNVCFKNASA